MRPWVRRPSSTARHPKKVARQHDAKRAAQCLVSGGHSRDQRGDIVLRRGSAEARPLAWLKTRIASPRCRITP